MAALDLGVRAACEQQAAAVSEWLAALDDTDLERPAVLPGWRVAELAVHLAQGFTAVNGPLAATRPPRGTPALSVARYTAAYEAAAVEIADRERAEAAGASADSVRRRFASQTATLARALDALAGTNPVVAARRGPIRVNDLLRTRVTELVVHSRDAARSVPDRPGPALVPAAVRIVTRLFTEILAERHPGRSVEVRVPPYAAVQVGAGPVHTRGTPPNVVEIDPVIFIDVASGRTSFAEASERGAVRASGLRADLAAYVPVLA